MTLVGAPGVGKTRLALQTAPPVRTAFSDGVWLVGLAPLADPDLVPHAVADVLGVREPPDRTLTAALAVYLRARRLLLVLDNCEHLVGATAALAETLLQACPSLHVLATSREPLAIEGEVTYRVPSLSVPALPDVGSSAATIVTALAGSEAVQLFVERARAAVPTFVLAERNAALIGQICRRLDGIPLAIELAAARVRGLSVEQIAARLDDRFRLLSGGSRTALPRQQTLRGAIDWSYDLLLESEQTLLRRLAVFAGGFELGAGSWVSGFEEAASSPDTRSPEPDTFVDGLLSLVDKSLVQVEEEPEEGAERRYRLLETFRQYGLEKLAEHGELEAARDRHRDYFLAFAEQIAPALNQGSGASSLALLERDHDNLRAALDWCLDEPDARSGQIGDGAARPSSGVALGVRLAAAIGRFWSMRGHTSDGRRLVARVLALLPSDADPTGLSLRALAPLGLAANLFAYQGGTRMAVALMTEHLSACRETGDDRGVVDALRQLGFYLAHLGERERPIQLCEESIALSRQIGDPLTVAQALFAMGTVDLILQRYQHSIAVCAEAVALCRPLGALALIAWTLRCQSLCTVELGDLATATRLAEEALDITERIGHRRGLAMSYKDLGRFAMLAGDHVRANELLNTALTIAQQMEDYWLSTICLSVLATVKAAQGAQRPAPLEDAHQIRLDAARLLAVVEQLCEQEGLALPADVGNTYERDLALIHELLGGADFARARAEGRAMSLGQAITYGLTITAPAMPASPVPEPRPAGDPDTARLSPREREVVALIVQGRTNREMGEALVLSERTIDSHVRNLMGKLEVNSRAQVAAWAVAHGLGTPR